MNLYNYLQQVSDDSVDLYNIWEQSISWVQNHIYGVYRKIAEEIYKNENEAPDPKIWGVTEKGPDSVDDVMKYMLGVESAKDDKSIRKYSYNKYKGIYNKYIDKTKNDLKKAFPEIKNKWKDFQKLVDKSEDERLVKVKKAFKETMSLTDSQIIEHLIGIDYLMGKNKMAWFGNQGSGVDFLPVSWWGVVTGTEE